MTNSASMFESILIQKRHGSTTDMKIASVGLSRRELSSQAPSGGHAAAAHKQITARPCDRPGWYAPQPTITRSKSDPRRLIYSFLVLRVPLSPIPPPPTLSPSPHSHSADAATRGRDPSERVRSWDSRETLPARASGNLPTRHYRSPLARQQRGNRGGPRGCALAASLYPAAG